MEIRQRPFFVRMIVAPRALQPRAEKNLTENFRQLRRRALVAINHSRPEAVRAAACSHHVARESVHRQVCAERFAQPLVEHVHTLQARTIRIRPHEVRPVIGPMVGISSIGQQPVNELGALVS